MTAKSGQNLSSITGQKHWINFDVMHAYSAVKGKCSVTKMSAKQRQMTKNTLNSPSYLQKHMIEKSTHSLSSIETQNQISEADVVTADMDAWLASSSSSLLLLLSTRGCKDSVWAPKAAADSPDSERRSGRPNHFRTLLLDRSYSCAW